MEIKSKFALCLVALVTILGAAEHSKKSSPGVKPLQDPPGIHNLFALGANVFSGSTPEGEEGFAALQKLGVKTILSVDGTTPDVALAKNFGMRYVHLPHGYDGISSNLQIRLAKVAHELPGPIYVHCHHGMHRGPAAAAVLCMAEEGWTPAQATAWLEAAGTSTNYAGLYQVARDFKKPTEAQLKALPSDFPEIAKVSGLVDTMVDVDARWENLKAVRAAGYERPKDHPDIHPANEAVILWEHYREAQRLPDAARHGKDFIERLKKAETEVKEAEQLLRQFSKRPTPETRARLDQSFQVMGRSCSSCHNAYRDVAGIKSAQ